MQMETLVALVPFCNSNMYFASLQYLFCFVFIQGSLHGVSQRFLEQTLDKKLMSNMRVSSKSRSWNVL